MASFSTFRSRLIVLFALATFPAVALALTLSWNVYVNAKAVREDGRGRTAVAAATQEAAVLRNALAIAQILVASSARPQGEADCFDRVGAVVSGQGSYSGIALAK